MCAYLKYILKVLLKEYFLLLLKALSIYYKYIIHYLFVFVKEKIHAK